MIRIMQISAGEIFGGVSAMVYSFYTNIDLENFQFDFVSLNKSPYKIYSKEIEDKGGRIIELKANGSLIIRKLKFWRRLYILIRQENYEVIHVNSGSASFNLQVAWIAKICGVKKIIVHSHNAGNSNNRVLITGKICKHLLEYGPSHYLACSHKAAQFMFTKKRIQKKGYYVVNNGIDIEKFRFSESSRKAYRKAIGLNEKKVFLHVGRFSDQKNHKKLVEIFNHFHSQYNDSILLLVGEGELLDQIHTQISKLHLEESVLFLGLRQDISELMSASDIFLLTSFYEGLPVVGVEAQANGLPCVFPHSITQEIDITNLIRWLPLDSSNQLWTEEIVRSLEKNDSRDRYATIVSDKGYSSEQSARVLEHIYS